MKRPTQRSRSPTRHGGGWSSTSTVSSACAGKSKRDPSSPTKTRSRNRPWLLGGLRKYAARMSDPKPIGIGVRATVASSVTNCPSPWVVSAGTHASITGWRKRKPAPRAVAASVMRSASGTDSRGRICRVGGPRWTAAVLRGAAAESAWVQRRTRGTARTRSAIPAQPAICRNATLSGRAASARATVANPLYDASTDPSHSPIANRQLLSGTSGCGLHARASARHREGVRTPTTD